MVKKIYAITAIKGSNVFVPAGDEVPQEQFSKEELKQLYDNGALEVRDAEDTQPVEVPVELPPAGLNVEPPVEE